MSKEKRYCAYCGIKLEALLFTDDNSVKVCKSSICNYGSFEKPKKLYTIEDIERCVENWGLCKVEREYIEKFLGTNQNKEYE